MSEQRVHQVREWVAEARRVHQWERERYGWYRAAVVFTWRRARQAVRYGAEDAVAAWFSWRQRVHAERHEASLLAVRNLEVSFGSVWGCGASVGV